MLFGDVGLIVELLLLGHTESVSQWIPIVLLGVSLIAGLAVAAAPHPRRLRTFQGVMALCVIAGVVGLYLHYRGNVEFELERDPSLRGLALFWEAIRGATPTLAPGALAQLGLLGLVYTFGHPALRRTSSARRPAGDEPRETGERR